MKKRKELFFLMALTFFYGCFDRTEEILDAAMCGNVDQVKSLLEKDPKLANAREDKFGQTPLILAAMNGRTEVAELLIANGAEVNYKMDPGLTPLHEAVIKGHVEVAELLIENGADLNGNYGMAGTPLYWAGKKGNREMVELLIAKGAEVNLRGGGGKTALHAAALKGHMDVVELLLSRGAEVNAISNDGKTPLKRALELRHGDVVDLLRKHGGLGEKVLPTDIHWATGEGDLEGVQALLEINPGLAKVEDKFTGDTPLHIAARKGYIDIAKLLIDAGADINARDERYEYTSLHFATTFGQKDLVELLINKGADINYKDKEGRTSLGIAIENGYDDIADYLRHHGAVE
jgi:cytohesin